MKQLSSDSLLGMMPAKDEGQIPDELFYQIFEIEDVVERTRYIENLKNEAAKKKRTSEFNNMFKAFYMDYQQRMRNTEQKTKFTGQEMELECGSWLTNDLGVYTEKFDKQGFPTRIMACSHPILPVKILKNVDTGEERVTLAYFKYGDWQHITVNREVCADNSVIVKVLSKVGVEVTSENAKYLVRYISDCIGLNPAYLKPIPAINRLGWCGNEFMPYAEDIVYDGDRDYGPIFRNVKIGGDYETWREHCSILRKNKIVRMAFAASAGSVLIELLNTLPFVFHIWSTKSGTCKTVAIMAAMSIWGNPKMGGLVKTMNTTKVGIMRNSAFLYSIPYAGDELQTMKDKWMTNFDQFIYQITEGIDRGRGRASGGVEETRTWKCSYLFTGEEPITKSNSRAGSKNRVIEVEAEEKLLEDGNHTVSVLTENYGFAGKMIVEYLQKTETKVLQEEYKKYFTEICFLDTTEKQAMAMSCILLADRILVELIFTEETPLTVSDVKQYLKAANEIDIADKAYHMTLNWIAKNPIRFLDPRGTDPLNRGEVWGKILEDEEHPEKQPVAIINKEVLSDFLEKNSFDYTAITKEWSNKELLIRNSQGKIRHQTKVYSIKASYLKILLNPYADTQEFIPADEYEQQELPFD